MFNNSELEGSYLKFDTLGYNCKIYWWFIIHLYIFRFYLNFVTEEVENPEK